MHDPRTCGRCFDKQMYLLCEQLPTSRLTAPWLDRTRISDQPCNYHTLWVTSVLDLLDVQDLLFVLRDCWRQSPPIPYRLRGRRISQPVFNAQGTACRTLLQRLHMADWRYRLRNEECPVNRPPSLPMDFDDNYGTDLMDQIYEAAVTRVLV